MVLKRRYVIYAQDIMVFTGRSRSYAYSILTRIKLFYGKEQHQLITFEEYADFHGIPVGDLIKTLFDTNT